MLVTVRGVSGRWPFHDLSFMVAVFFHLLSFVSLCLASPDGPFVHPHSPSHLHDAPISGLIVSSAYIPILRSYASRCPKPRGAQKNKAEERKSPSNPIRLSNIFAPFHFRKLPLAWTPLLIHSFTLSSILTRIRSHCVLGRQVTHSRTAHVRTGWGLFIFSAFSLGIQR